MEFRRLVIGLALTLASLPAPRAAAAPPSEGRVAALLSEDINAYRQALAGFKKNYKGPVIDFDMGPSGDRLGEIRANHPDLVLAIGVRAAKAAAEGLPDVPVVYCMVLDPEINGISGSNVTGVTLAVPVKRQLEELKRTLPAVGKVGVVYSPAKSGELIEEARSAASAVGATLLAEAVQRSDQVPDALARLAGKVDALWLPPDATVVTKETFKLALELSLARKIPMMVFNSQFVKAGALLALSPDFESSGADAAKLVKMVLGGKKPSEIPVTFSRGTLFLNVSTAKALGLDIPPAVLAHAEQVE